MKRKLFTLMLTLGLLLQFIPLTVFASTLDTQKKFTVQIQCDDLIDLSQIELLVYLETTTETSDTGFEAIHEEYAFSIFTDSSGTASFDLPSTTFSINLNLSTIPNGYGADNYTHYYGNNQTYGYFTLRAIERAEIVKTETDYKVVAYDAMGFPLLVEAEVTSNLSIMQSKIPSTYNEYVRYSGATYELTAQLGEMTLHRSVKDDITNMSPANKNQFLYEAGLITKSDYIRTLCEQITSDDAWYTDVQPCRTGLVTEINEYARTMNTNDPNYELIRSTASVTGIPQYVNGGYTYPSTTDPLYNSAPFIVHYGSVIHPTTNSVYNIPESKAQLLYEDLLNAKKFWCTEAGFNMPVSNQNDGKYHVYLSPSALMKTSNNEPVYGYATAVTTNSAESYIVYNETVARSSDSSISMGAIAHEFMHAMLYTYGVKYATNPPEFNWFHESLADFAGIVYSVGSTYNTYNDFAAALSAGTTYQVSAYNTYLMEYREHVNQYLSSVDLGLIQTSSNPAYEQRHYGSIFWAMDILIVSNGLSGIKTLLQSYETYDNPLTALDAYYPLGFGSMYAHSVGQCYHPKLKYPIRATGWLDTAIDTYTMSYYPHTHSQINIARLSCYYKRFLAPSSGSYKLTVTTTLSSTTTPSDSFVLVNYPISSTHFGQKQIGMTSNQVIVTQSNFGNVYDHVMVAFVNASLSASGQYSQTAKITSTSTNALVPEYEITYSPLDRLGIT